MKLLLLLSLVVCGAMAAMSPQHQAKRRKLQQHFDEQAVRWVNTPPYRPVTEYDHVTINMLEVAAFGNLPPQGQAAVDSVMDSNRRRPGVFSGPGGTGKIERVNAFSELRNLAGAKSTLSDMWGESGRRPGDTRPAGPGVFGATLGPDAIANMAAQLLENQGRETTDRRVRMDYRCMSTEEREKYHGAVNLLKQSLVNGSNAYDIFAVLHNFQTAPTAHQGPAFLPWHRHYLWLYEEALHQVEPGVTLPYWDSSHEATLTNPLASAIWKDDFLGTANGAVRTGPFAGWMTPTGAPLTRRVSGDLDWVYNDESFQIMMEPDTFIEAFIEHELEHNGPHNYIAGTMANLDTAAMEPAFYMHHAFVDCLWEEWRELKQYPSGNAESDYPTDAQIASMGRDPRHGAQQTANPFRVNNAYGLRRVYTQLYYRCQPRGTCPGNVCGEDGYGASDCVPRPPPIVSSTTPRPTPPRQTTRPTPRPTPPRRTTRPTPRPTPPRRTTRPTPRPTPPRRTTRPTPRPVTNRPNIPYICRSVYRPRWCSGYYTTRGYNNNNNNNGYTNHYGGGSVYGTGKK